MHYLQKIRANKQGRKPPTHKLMRVSQGKKNVAILVSGGDCQVINTVLATFIKNYDQYNLFVVLNGYEGLYKDEIICLSSSEQVNLRKDGLNTNNKIYERTGDLSSHAYHFDSINNNFECFFPYDSGSAIKTSRFPDLRNQIEHCRKNLEKHNIDRLIVLGGDGSIKGAHLFDNTYTIPCSIDNDTHSMYALGVFTAVQQVQEYIECVIPSNIAMGRNAVYEVMGNRKGFIAILSYFATYCDFVLLNESRNCTERDVLGQNNDLKGNQNCSYAANRQNLKRSERIIFADSSVDSLVDNIKHSRNVSVIVSEKNNKYNLETFKDDNTRLINIGFMQRGGIPTFTDRKLGVMCAYEIIKSFNRMMNGDVFINDARNIMLAERNNQQWKEMSAVENNIFNNNLTRMILKYSLNYTNDFTDRKIIIIRDDFALGIDDVKKFVDFYGLKDFIAVYTVEKNVSLDFIVHDTTNCNECIKCKGLKSKTLSLLYTLPLDVRNNNLVVLGNQRDVSDLKNTNNIVVPIDKIRGFNNFISRETILNNFLVTIDDIIRKNERKNYFIKCKKWIIEELRIVYDYYIQHERLASQIFIRKDSDLSFLHVRQNKCNIILGTKKLNTMGNTIKKINVPIARSISVIDKIYLRLSLLIAMKENGGIVTIEGSKAKVMKWITIKI